MTESQSIAPNPYAIRNLRDRTRFWWEQPNSENQIANVDDEATRAAAFALRDDGIAVLEGFVSSAFCDDINRDFAEFCSQNKAESDHWRLPTGFHPRLTNFHTYSAAAREALMSGRLTAVLDALFGEKTALCSSLYFEQSTEQPIHRDSPFFCSNPYGQFFGVWIALEDIRPQAGPLNYRPGGHKLDIDQVELALRNPDLDVGQLYGKYLQEIKQRCDDEGLPVSTVLPKKGDVVIWHPELPHGGGKILDGGGSRKSIVYHVMPETAPIYGIDIFFGRQEAADSGLPLVDCSFGRKMLGQGSPAFAPNV